MSWLQGYLPADFLPQFLGGMAVNLEIAAIALALGLMAGVLLAFARLAGGVVGGASAAVIGLMRAAPTFVVMFFLLNAIPRDASFLGFDIALSGFISVALSLVPYSAAYVADSASDSLRQLRAGSPLAALLFLPNVTRAFFVLVMSSSAGAAVGVTEGVTVILRAAEKMPSLGDRLLLFAFGIFCFGVVLQAGFAAMRLLQKRLSAVAMQRLAATP